MSIPSSRPLLKLVAAAAAILLLIDVLLFRSGAYFAWAEPRSTAGWSVSTTLAVDRLHDPARKNILVLGNSKIGEGFSGALADAASGRNDLHFINAGIPGTTPRVWNYLLRAVDPGANRFAAVALMVDYDVAAIREDLADNRLDTSYTVPLLHIGDLFDYPASFHDPGRRERARRAILLPLQVLHEDALAFLAHPLDRIQGIREYRPGWLAAVGNYQGHEQALPELSIDPDKGMPADWGTLEATQRSRLEDYFQKLHVHADPALQEANTAYLQEWVGRIAGRYRANGIPVIIFVVPRGPWHHVLAPVPALSGAVAELAASGTVDALPGDAFTDLEQPLYFFDELHMNRAGRTLFSQRLAARIATLVR